MPVRVLFVDDEPAIRETLPPIFAIHGFEVTPAGTVKEALAKITSQEFDVLIADLNIGQPGDGFTVVSAMRRTQPNCVTLILTGYPALETALQAIRSQVDDYVIKPASIPELIVTVNEKLKNRTQQRVAQIKRLSDILRDNITGIVGRATEQMKSYPQMITLALSGAGWAEALAGLVQSLAIHLDSGEPTLVPDQVLHAAALSGAARRSDVQYCASHCSAGSDVATLMEIVRSLERVIFDLVQENLVVIDLSYLMSDLKRLNDGLGVQAEKIVAAFLGPDQPA